MLKSMYLLDYIDVASLRDDVQRAVNHGETYHQWCLAIAHVSGNRFRGKSDENRVLWNACARLWTHPLSMCSHSYWRDYSNMLRPKGWQSAQHHQTAIAGRLAPISTCTALTASAVNQTGSTCMRACNQSCTMNIKVVPLAVLWSTGCSGTCYTLGRNVPRTPKYSASLCTLSLVVLLVCSQRLPRPTNREG